MRVVSPFRYVQMCRVPRGNLKTLRSAEAEIERLINTSTFIGTGHEPGSTVRERPATARLQICPDSGIDVLLRGGRNTYA